MPHKLSLPRRTYGDKAASSKLIHFTPSALVALSELASDRRETATACFAAEFLHAIVAGDEPLIDEIGERLYLSLPSTVTVEKIRANLNGLACAVERAGLRRLAAEGERE